MNPARTNKTRLTFVSLLMAIAMLLRPVFASANPEGGVVAAGQANIITAPTMVDIHQQTHKVVIDWRGFDIAPNERTEFHQPSTSAIALNRVNSPNASRINGTLKANGNIIIVNQNGVLFGREAKVDVNGLVATSADTDNDRFMNEAKVTLDKAGSPDAVVSNEGTITAKESGLVGFVAPRVENSGVITARLGRVQLASGEKATVDFYGDGLLEVAVGEEVTHQLAKNTGTINAEGGTIALTAAAGRKLLSSSIEVGGELHAQTVSQQEGKIIIAAAGKNAVTNNIAANKNGSNSNVASTVTVRGKLHASGNKAGERGGKITITGDEIALKSGTNISAKGAAGGGVIRIGGEYLGQGTTPTARTTTVESGAILDASATEQGHGGEVIVFADGDTIFNGLIYANGAGQRGNGGFVETSGKSRLHIGGMVYATASGSGRAGQWLLDPADITITAATNSNITGSTPFTATNTGSQLSAATIVTALNAGTNVTVQTNNDAFAGNGDIFVNSAITSTGAGALTISAFRNILVSAAISLNGGSLTLRSDNTGIGSGAITTSAALSTNGGNITIGGGNGAITAATYNANGSVATAASGFARGNAAMTQGVTIGGAINSGNNGNIIINGRGFTGTASSVGVEQLAGNAITATGTGSIQISGINQGTAANSTQSNGVVLRNNVTTLNGAIQIQGQGGAGTDTTSNSGVLISSTGGLVRSTGTGAITLSGVGGSSTGGRNYGVLVNNTSGVSPTGGGTILIYGQGGNAGSNNAGVAINDAGTGSIVAAASPVTINGFGGTSTGTGNHGVLFNGTGAGIGALTTTTGAITISGTGGGSGASSNSHGIFVTGTGATITKSGAGAVTLTGTGGAGTGGTNHGIFSTIGSGILSSGAGTLSLSGTAGSGVGSVAVASSVANAIRSSSSGAITLRGNSFNISAANAVNSNSTLTIAPLTAVTFGLGTGAGVATIDNTSLGNIAATTGYIFGSTTTPDITVDTTVPFTSRALTFTSSGNITLNNSFNQLTSLTTTSPTGATTINAAIGAVTAIGAYTATGRDLLINASLRSSANIAATLTRDITLAAGATLTNGAGSALTLRAANNNVNGTGNLSLLGNLNVGTGTLTLSSGVNGTRPSWTANTTSLQRQGANFGTISIQGFLNTTIDRQLNSNGNVTILSFENLGITSGTNVTTGTGTNSLSLRAANGVASALGTLSIDGTIGVGRGSLTLLSGVDGGGSRPSLALSTSKLSRLSTSFGAISIQGFNDITLDQLLNSTGNVALSNNTRIFLQNTTSSTGGTITFSNPVVIAEGQTATVTTTNRNIAFSSTINGTAGGAVETLTVNPGTANATFSSTIDGIGLNVSAGTATFNGVLGGTTALNATSISAINALTLPNVTASSLFAETTGATARLSLNGSVTSTGLGNALTINSSNTLTKGGAGNITTNNGVITLSAANFLYLANSFNILSGGSDIILTAPTNIVSTGTVSIISGGGDVNLNGPVSISAPLTLTLGSGALTFGGAVNGNNNFASTFSVLAVGAGGGSGGSDGAVIGGGGGGGAAVDSVVNTAPNALYTISVGGGGGAGVSDNAGASSVGLGGINGGGIGGRAGTTGTSGGGGGGGGWSGISSGGTNFVIAGGGAGGGGANEGTANDVGAQGGGSQLNGANTNSNGAAGTNFSGNGGGGGGGGGGLLGGRGQSALTGAALSSGGSNFGNAANVSNNITNGNAGDTEAGGGAGGGTPGIAGARATFYGLGGLEGAGGDGSTNSDGADGVVIIRYTGSESQAVIVGGVATTVGGDTIITYSNPGAGLFSPISGCSGSCNLTVTAGSVTFGGEIGTTTPLDNVSITTTDAMALPSVTATNILARTTNATANLTILPGSVLTATGTGTPLTLAAGRDFINNAGAGALVVSGTGSPRWLVYSTNPANDTVGGLSNNFNRYSCAYASGGNCAFNATLNQTVSVPASGNGLLYSYTPTINITPAAISNLVYGAATPSLTGYAYNTITSADYLSAGDFAADSITGSLDGSTTYAPGPVTGGVGNYNIDYVSGNLVSLLGYGFTYANNANAITVIPRTVTVSLIGAVSRVYDGSLAATLAAGNYSISNVFAGDVLGISNTSGIYDTKHVGTGKTITVTGLTLTGAPVANYVLSSTTASGAIGDITARALTIGAVGINRVYNGLTGATVTLNDDRVAGDVLTTGYTTADFSDRHVGTGKTVTVNGLTLSGTDAGNYTFNTSASTTADITARALTIGAVGINRVYNGLTGATVTLTDDRVAGDVLTTGYTTADFTTKDVGTGKTVTVNGLTLSGTDAGNYTFNTSASTTADITARALTIGAVGINRVYNGLTGATVTLTDDRVAGDVLTTGYTTANFTTKDVGTGKTVTVNGLTLSGTDAGNYTFNTSTSTTADITARALTIGAVGINKPFDGNTAANVTLNDDRIAGDLLSTGFGTANFATSSPGVGILITVNGITLSGIDAGNYTFNTSATTMADITGSVPAPTPSPTPAPSVLPNTVVKVTQDTGEAVTSSSDDGIYASPTTMYQLVYLPANAPTENRILNRAPQVRSAAGPLTTAFVAPDEEKRLRNARAKRSRNLLARGSRTFIFDANTPAVRRPGGFEASPSVKSI